MLANVAEHVGRHTDLPLGESIGLMLRGFVGANPRVRPFCRTSGQTHGSAPYGDIWVCPYGKV
jgi:hypothetical protein